MELAIINGTYRDTTAKTVAGGLSMYPDSYAYLGLLYNWMFYKISLILVYFEDKAGGSYFEGSNGSWIKFELLVSSVKFCFSIGSTYVPRLLL